MENVAIKYCFREKTPESFQQEITCSHFSHLYGSALFIRTYYVLKRSLVTVHFSYNEVSFNRKGRILN